MKKMATFSKVLTILFAMVGMMANVGLGQLSYSRPWNPCPKAEAISKRITTEAINRDPTLAPSMIRLVYHDCFIRGCDASVLLDPTPSNNATEKTAMKNSSMRGYDVVDAIKEELEKECPGKVSCADVIALASRDAITAIKGPYWDVHLGRKDGKISRASEVMEGLPSRLANISSLIKSFGAVGLTAKDMTVLVGAHTIGNLHCMLIQDRLYNNTFKDGIDPKLDPDYAGHLKTKCPQSKTDFASKVPMDPYTPTVFDANYFKAVSQHKGLLVTDAALLDDPTTKSYVLSQASDRATWHKDFAVSIGKFINVGGKEGEIRKNCRKVNSQN